MDPSSRRRRKEEEERQHPDAHLYESDRQLFRDRISRHADSLIRQDASNLFASDENLFKQGADLWSSDRLLYRTKEDFEEESLARDIERLKRDRGFVFGDRSSGEKGEILDVSSRTSSALPECAVCLVEFVNGDRCIRLKCKHAYHETCIVKTLEREKRECPLCRSKDL